MSSDSMLSFCERTVKRDKGKDFLSSDMKESLS